MCRWSTAVDRGTKTFVVGVSSRTAPRRMGGVADETPGQGLRVQVGGPQRRTGGGGRRGRGGAVLRLQRAALGALLAERHLRPGVHDRRRRTWPLCAPGARPGGLV